MLLLLGVFLEYGVVIFAIKCKNIIVWFSLFKKSTCPFLIFSKTPNNDVHVKTEKMAQCDSLNLNIVC